ncbi:MULTISPECIES: 2-amino-4-hydroxy-6-hydroxymethyldihydropteridine diphosphokinase [Ureibacillus]|jgi:2-amino-4-hydroxy-6-hydroxymethyldihydropteridine diphosphokinase|uniref:2-amino-4-hydroxy-6- hydroxymethyldihydropteridine diphosphokinase n=1 Tax=Ureibacillus TaxID=160795 RepID=UPI0002F168C9|nr:2-amino-4-hydroxy-6-hydroxymethyldihydropteridine diphosphokinase [Ureibacillus thermosphaericus]NKZ32377.1 2-amino-4-hydroxy-6-hydroxymethyldihydropteridine diphosphokinase [Ureibacillus thermosphaericus]
MVNDVYLSLGTNLGDRENNLKSAIDLLQSKEGIWIKKISPIYETAPVGYVDQPSFLNIAIYAQTILSPIELLQTCQLIENDLGRVRNIRWGPRIIDLDILLFNNDNIESENLIIPHPRMFERAFVLVPLLDIASKPYSEKLIQAEAALKNINLEKEGIKKWKDYFSL